MAEMYGHRWTSNFGDKADPDSAWATVLQGLTGQQLANGLNILVHKGQEYDWPPPANVFRSLCLQVPGLPTNDDAWEQALSGQYEHEIVRLAAQATGTFDLKSAKLGDKPLRKRFDRFYAILRARLVMGKPLDDSIPEGIEHEEKTPMQVQYAHTHRQARDLVTAQNIPTDGQQARKLLLARLGIKRGGEQHA